MKLEEVHPSVQVALGLHEALRRLGFISDGIYVHLVEGNLYVAVMDSKREPCLIPAGPYDGDRERIAEEWASVAAAVNEGRLPEADVHACLLQAVPEGRATDFAAAVLRAGVRIPGKKSN